MPHLPPLKAALLKVAKRLQQQLRPSCPYRTVEQLSQTIAYHTQRLARLQRLWEIARSRHWTTATACLHDRQVELLRLLLYHLRDWEHHLVPCAPPPPSLCLRELYNDLLALTHEFDQVAVDEGRVSVVTQDIELEGVYLGPFRIELELDRLVHRQDASAFLIVALDPHPAAGSDDVTHPHVKDRHLCAGEATTPIARALSQGRLLDAFLAVHAVLQTYNPGSPYVPLAEWHAGVCCCDCGGRTDPEDISVCEDCDQDFCPDCISYCDRCQASICRACLDEDPVSHGLLCSHCRRTCRGCNRTVDSDSFDAASRLCPECLDAQQPEDGAAEQEPLDVHT